MTRIPPVATTPPAPVHHHLHKKPAPPPSTSLARDPPFQGSAPKVGLGVSLKI